MSYSADTVDTPAKVAGALNTLDTQLSSLFAEMTVCDDQSRTSGKVNGKEVAGTCVIAGNPYKFYALEDQTRRTVSLMMPVGGETSGLYRFPRVGEAVLVLHSGTSYYLAGYLPTAGSASGDQYNVGLMPFQKANGKDDTKAGIINKDAEVFRYKKRGDNTADDEWSEIGFYQEKTNWPKTAEEEDCPKVDRLNIQSTGDLYVKAQNYQQFKGKRLEIAADKTPGNDTDAGDINILAGHAVSISADESITLRAGRSSIFISDRGIIIKAAKVGSALAGESLSQAAGSPLLGPTQSQFGTSQDAMLVLYPVDGVGITGAHVALMGLNDVKMGDAYGGGFSSRGGVTRIGGADIKLETSSLLEYLIAANRKNIALLPEIFSQVATALVTGAQNFGGWDLGIAQKGTATAFAGVGAAVSAIFAYREFKARDLNDPDAGKYADIAGGIVSAVDIICEIGASVAYCLSLWAPQMFKGLKGDAKSAALYTFEDSLNFLVEILEAVTWNTATAAIAHMKLYPDPGAGVAAANVANPTSSVLVHLMAGSQLLHDAGFTRKFHGARRNFASPSAGLGNSILSKALGTQAVLADEVLAALTKVSYWAVQWIDDPDLGTL